MLLQLQNNPLCIKKEDQQVFNKTKYIWHTIVSIQINNTLMIIHTGTLSHRAAKKIPNGAAHASAGSFT